MMASLDSLGTHIWDGLLEPQEETAQHINCSKEETDEQTAVGTRCGASASNFSRGCNQPASAMQSFGLDDNMEAEMSNEYPYDECYHTPCVPQNPTREESSVLVHGLYTLRTARLPQANVTGAPAQDDRARSTNEHCELPLQATTDRFVPDFLHINGDSLTSTDGMENMGLDNATTLLLSLLGDKTPFGLYDDASFAPHMANEGIHLAKRKHTASSPLNPIPSPGPYIPCIDWLHQGSSALVPGQYTPLYNPPLLAGITSAPLVQDETIHSPPLNPAPQYPVISSMPTAKDTGHECVCTNSKNDCRSKDGRCIIVDNLEELQSMVHCCTQTPEITWDMGKLIKLTDKDRGAFVSRFKQKQKPRIIWSSNTGEPTIPFTGVPFALAKPSKITICCPNFNCSARICIRLIWTFPNSYICDHCGAAPLNTERVRADICSGKIIPVAQYRSSVPTRQAHTCLQNRPTHSAMSLTVLATAPPVD